MRNKKLVIATLTAAMLLGTGCVYRIDVPQGNFVEQKQVEQLRVGMSRAQVEYVLGSPMLQDAFDNDVWHYVYYLREGWNEPKQKQLTVRFVNDKLASVSGDFPAPASFNLPLYSRGYSRRSHPQTLHLGGFFDSCFSMGQRSVSACVAD